ncbi:MAG TPA: hypothetical protein VKG89_03235 [Solirubrobacterales bacterium]|nr:hypothetical protein [Solirubrobacterales bacterium]
MAVELRPLPASFAATRDALHRVAEELVAPARKPHNEIALRQTPGGFGTPEFEFEGRQLQVRVAGPELVLDRDGQESRTALTSIAEVAELLGPGLLPDGMPADRTPLRIDPEAAARLADFYAFAAEVLERSREELQAGARPSELNLWPEHFDIAYEAGDEDAGMRANYGASPGDGDHPEPYVYVGPWTAEVSGELWNATAFSGAELSYSELLSVDRPASGALEFLRSRSEALAGSG